MTRARELAAAYDGTSDLELACVQHSMSVCKDIYTDRRTYVFRDRSVIVFYPDGWDYGYEDCFCAQALGHRFGCDSAEYHDHLAVAALKTHLPEVTEKTVKTFVDKMSRAVNIGKQWLESHKMSKIAAEGKKARAAFLHETEDMEGIDPKDRHVMVRDEKEQKD